MPYLLAAEADKIQDFVFRSSRLREITGASQLLQQFCQQVAEQLITSGSGSIHHNAKAIVSSGGSFRIKFMGNNEQDVKVFGEELAELYRLTLNSSIAVAKPVQYSGDAADFPTANEQARQKLRQAKLRRVLSVATEHMPFMAFCTSCGIGLADRHSRLAGEKEDQRGRYLCASCTDKAQHRWDDRSTLLDDFLNTAVISADKKVNQWPDEADQVAKYDWQQRNYVAYLIADGNGVGNIFSCCSEEQIRVLSQELPQIVRDSLAVPTGQLINQLLQEEQDETIPVLPLIMAGDDIFVLISATYALDFARRFCLEFESRLRSFLTQEGIPGNPTMAAAVVICKSKYPYTLAHRRGEELLEETKRHVKQLAAQTGEHLSAIHFEVITGNQITGQAATTASAHLGSSLRPYWVSKMDGENPVELPKQSQAFGVDLTNLLKARHLLKDIPNSRLIALRDALDHMPVIREDDAPEIKLHAWFTKQVEPIIQRASAKQAKNIREAFQLLGNPDPSSSQLPMLHLQRPSKDGDRLAHGMLDLLESWGYAQDMSRALQDYEAEEYEAEEMEQK